MAAVNFDPLAGSGYIHQNTRSVGPRTITRYMLIDSRSEEKVKKAVEAIIELLSKNVSLCPVFKMEPQDAFTQIVRDNPYLVINGVAVCLSLHPKAPESVQPQFVDKFFSEAVLETPIKCQSGHLLEKRFIELWAVKFPDRCPAGAHPIGSLDVDPEEQEDVNRFRASQSKEEEKSKNWENLAAQAQVTHTDTQRTLARYRVDRRIEITGAMVKIATKAGTYVFLNGIKFGEKVIIKGACVTCKEAFKRLPVLSLFIGIGLGFYRLRQGEWVRAGGEVASGALACSPGFGTAASIALDLAMFSYDVYETSQGVRVDMSIEKAHATLQLPYDPAHPPTAKQIHAATRKASGAVHPDTVHRLGEYTKEDAEELQVWINGCKELLLNHYGYAQHAQEEPPV